MSDAQAWRQRSTRYIWRRYRKCVRQVWKYRAMGKNNKVVLPDGVHNAETIAYEYQQFGVALRDELKRRGREIP